MKSLKKVVIWGMATAVLVGGFAVPGAGAAGACSAVSTEGDWTTIEAPVFPGTAAPQDLKSYSIDAREPSRINVTNGQSVMKSEDGGCSWKVTFTLELLPTLDKPISSATATVQSIVMPEAAGKSSNAYLVIEERVGPVVRPHILASEDNGKSWELRDQGLPLTGDVLRMRIAPNDPDTFYLLTIGATGGNRMYASTNAGKSWEGRGPMNGGDFHVDPANKESLWFYRTPGLDHSVDGGRSSANNNYVPSTIGTGVVYGAPGEKSRVIVWDSDGGSYWRTDDGGLTFEPIATPGLPALSMAHGNGRDSIILSTHKAVFRYRAPGAWVEITPGVAQGVERDEDAPDIHELIIDRTATPSVFGMRPREIMKYSGLSIELPPLSPEAPPEPGEVTFGPPDEALKLAPGESKTVRYKLGLPPQPTPLDVFFLVDTTASMESSINGLAKGIHEIVAELGKSKVDVQFGLGEYKDYPIPGYGDPVSLDFPYRRNRDLGPADDSLVSAIERMQASGGGAIHEESQLTALFQAATGLGDEFTTPGQAASFRPGSLKVMINVTDAGFTDEPQHPSPPFEVVGRELKGRGILQIGLAVFGPYGIENARTDLSRMATLTDTVAPPGGVDCDSNGVIDIPEGEPLVCDITDEETSGVLRLAPAILSTLRAITDSAPVELVPTKGEQVIKSITPSLLPAVDVKDPQNLVFDVTYACSRSSARKNAVKLVPTVRGVGVAGAAATVTCKPDPIAAIVKKKKREPKPEPVFVPPPVAPAILPAIVPAPVPPPPPAPVSQIQPNPNPHVQGAAAQQEQQEQQLATVGVDTSEETELAFSTYQTAGRRGDPAILFFYMGAAAMATAFGALTMRSRTRLARESARRRHY